MVTHTDHVGLFGGLGYCIASLAVVSGKKHKLHVHHHSFNSLLTVY